MPDYELSQDIIDRYNEDGAVLIKGAFTQGKASFTRRVFDVCGCGRKLLFVVRKIRKFTISAETQLSGASAW